MQSFRGTITLVVGDNLGSQYIGGYKQRKAKRLVHTFYIYTYDIYVRVVMTTFSC